MWGEGSLVPTRKTFLSNVKPAPGEHSIKLPFYSMLTAERLLDQMPPGTCLFHAAERPAALKPGHPIRLLVVYKLLHSIQKRRLDWAKARVVSHGTDMLCSLEQKQFVHVEELVQKFLPRLQSFVQEVVENPNFMDVEMEAVDMQRELAQRRFLILPKQDGFLVSRLAGEGDENCPWHLNQSKTIVSTAVSFDFKESIIWVQRDKPLTASFNEFLLSFLRLPQERDIQSQTASLQSEDVTTTLSQLVASPDFLEDLSRMSEPQKQMRAMRNLLVPLQQGAKMDFDKTGVVTAFILPAVCRNGRTVLHGSAEEMTFADQCIKLSGDVLQAFCGEDEKVCCHTADLLLAHVDEHHECVAAYSIMDSLFSNLPVFRKALLTRDGIDLLMHQFAQLQTRTLRKDMRLRPEQFDEDMKHKSMGGNAHGSTLKEPQKATDIIVHSPKRSDELPPKVPTIAVNFVGEKALKVPLLQLTSLKLEGHANYTRSGRRAERKASVTALRVSSRNRRDGDLSSSPTDSPSLRSSNDQDNELELTHSFDGKTATEKLRDLATQLGESCLTVDLTVLITHKRESEIHLWAKKGLDKKLSTDALSDFPSTVVNTNRSPADSRSNSRNNSGSTYFSVSPMVANVLKRQQSDKFYGSSGSFPSQSQVSLSAPVLSPPLAFQKKRSDSGILSVEPERKSSVDNDTMMKTAKTDLELMLTREIKTFILRILVCAFESFSVLPVTRNPVNLIFVELVNLHRLSRTEKSNSDDLEISSLLYRLLNQFTLPSEEAHVNKLQRLHELANGSTVELGIRDLLRQRKKLDLFLWRVHRRVEMLLRPPCIDNEIVYEEEAIQLWMLADYLSKTQSRVMPGQVVDVCMEVLLAVKKQCVVSSAFSQAPFRDLFASLLAVLGQILRLASNKAMVELLCSVWFTTDVWGERLKQFAGQLLLSSRMVAIINEGQGPHKLRMYRITLLQFFQHSADFLLNIGKSPQLMSTLTTFSTGNMPYPQMYKPTYGQLQPLVDQFHWLLRPEKGYISKILMSSSSDISVVEPKREALKLLAKVFALKLDDSPFLRDEYIDFYLRYAYLNFLKVYNGSLGESNIAMTRLYLNILLSLALNKNASIVRKFYQFRVMDSLVREIDLEYEVSQSREKFMRLRERELKKGTTLTVSENESGHTSDSTPLPAVTTNKFQRAATTDLSSIPPKALPAAEGGSSPVVQALALPRSVKKMGVPMLKMTKETEKGRPPSGSANSPARAVPSLNLAVSPAVGSSRTPTAKKHESLCTDSETDKERETSPNASLSADENDSDDDWRFPINPQFMKDKIFLEDLKKSRPPIPALKIPTPMRDRPKLSSAHSSDDGNASRKSSIIRTKASRRLGLGSQPVSQQSSVRSIIERDDESDRKHEPAAPSSAMLTISAAANALQVHAPPPMLGATDNKKRVVPKLNLAVSVADSNRTQNSKVKLAKPSARTNMSKESSVNSLFTDSGRTHTSIHSLPPKPLLTMESTRTEQPVRVDLEKGLTHLEKALNVSDPKSQLILGNAQGHQSPHRSMADLKAGEFLTSEDLISENVFYFNERRQRMCYIDDEIHVQILTLIFALILTHDKGVLEDLYCDQHPLQNKKQNIPFFLHLHLNHAANEHILPKLSECIGVAGPGNAGNRLLKLLCTRLWRKNLYSDWQKIATGAYGTVFRSHTPFPPHDVVAVKLLDLPRSIHDRCVLHDIFTEITCLETFKFDERVSQLLDYGVDDQYYWIVMRHYPSSLKEWRAKQSGNFKDQLASYLALYKKILYSVQWLHSNQITHYDIKCDNILIRPRSNANSSSIEEMDVSIADFGESLIFGTEEGEFCTKNKGTDYIKSPEMLTIANAAKKERETYDRRKKLGTNRMNDVWSLGCLLYEILTGDFLFFDHDWIHFFIRVTSPAEELLTPEKISKIDSNIYLVDFLRFVLVRDPVRRPSLVSVIQRFETLCSALVPRMAPSVSSTTLFGKPAAFDVLSLVEARQAENIVVDRVLPPARAQQCKLVFELIPVMADVYVCPLSYMSSSISRLKEARITHIVNCSGVPQVVPSFAVLNLRWNGPDKNASDMIAQLPDIMDFVRMAVVGNGRVVFVDQEELGVPWSIILAILMDTLNLSFFETFTLVASQNVLLDPSVSYFMPLLRWGLKRNRAKQTLSLTAAHRCVCGACSVVLSKPLDSTKRTNPIRCACKPGVASVCPSMGMCATLLQELKLRFAKSETTFQWGYTERNRVLSLSASLLRSRTLSDTSADGQSQLPKDPSTKITCSPRSDLHELQVMPQLGRGLVSNSHVLVRKDEPKNTKMRWRMYVCNWCESPVYAAPIDTSASSSPGSVGRERPQSANDGQDNIVAVCTNFSWTFSPPTGSANVNTLVRQPLRSLLIM